MNSLKDRDQITLRLTKSLKQYFLQKAKEMGIPLNSYIAMVLTNVQASSSADENSKVS